jgi:hypothetical protein
MPRKRKVRRAREVPTRRPQPLATTPGTVHQANGKTPMQVRRPLRRRACRLSCSNKPDTKSHQEPRQGKTPGLFHRIRFPPMPALGVFSEGAIAGATVAGPDGPGPPVAPPFAGHGWYRHGHTKAAAFRSRNTSTNVAGSMCHGQTRTGHCQGEEPWFGLRVVMPAEKGYK